MTSQPNSTLPRAASVLPALGRALHAEAGAPAPVPASATQATARTE